MHKTTQILHKQSHLPAQSETMLASQLKTQIEPHFTAKTTPQPASDYFVSWCVTCEKKVAVGCMYCSYACKSTDESEVDTDSKSECLSVCSSLDYISSSSDENNSCRSTNATACSLKFNSRRKQRPVSIL